MMFNFMHNLIFIPISVNFSSLDNLVLICHTENVETSKMKCILKSIYLWNIIGIT